MATLRPNLTDRLSALAMLMGLSIALLQTLPASAQHNEEQLVVDTSCDGRLHHASRVRIETDEATSRVVLAEGTPCLASGTVLMEVRLSERETMQGLMYLYSSGARIGYGFTVDSDRFDWRYLSSANLSFNDGQRRQVHYNLRTEPTISPCRARISHQPDNSGYGGYRCLCPPLAEVQESWMPGVKGTNIYAMDSNTCQAAVHAGALGVEGGVVRIMRPIDPNFLTAMCPYFYGSSQNGIQSEGTGKSIAFYFDGSSGLCDESSPPESEDLWYCRERFSDYDQDLEIDGAFSCHCSEAATSFGTVFGTEHYTGDSSICLAAFHWGAVGAEGGTVQVVPELGRATYRGSTRNEVTSYNWRAYPFGFRFE